MQLNDLVLSTIQDFVSNNVLFTALDVSNKVKEALPFARHREVRDLVRSLFQSDIEPANYAKTPIEVSLADGSSVEAILYHPLADSWDLDTKYSTQQRQQTALKPGQNVAAPVSVPKVQASSVLNVSSTQVANVSPTQVASPPAALVSTSASAQWSNLFNSQPSLFPRK